MKDLSITQEYMICTVNGKGVLPSSNQKAVVCLILSGLMDMQLAKCISLNDKKVNVCAELPEHLAYLRPLYDVINQEKTIKVEKVVETYTIAFTNKKLYELVDAVMEGLKGADAVEPAKAGLLGNKEIYVPKKANITRVIEKIRAELLEDGEISEDVIVLTALMDEAGNLKDYFSKYEQKELKNKIKAIKESEAGTLSKEMVQYIEVLQIVALLPLIFSN